MRLKNIKLLNVVQFLIAVVILTILLYYIDIGQLIDALTKLNPLFLLLAIFCYLLNNLLMSYRLKKILSSIGHKVRFKIAFGAHMSGMLLSDFTPARSGYLYTAYALKKSGIPLDRGLASITCTYLLDLCFKIFVGLLGLYYVYSYLTASSFGVPLLITLGLIVVVITGYLIIMHPNRLLLDFGERFALFGKVLEFGKQSKLVQKQTPFILTISFVGWVLRGLQWFFVSLSISAGILSLMDSLFLNPVLTLLSFIPLTPGGIGIQEAGIIGFLTLMGVNKTFSGLFALIVRAIEILVDLLGIKALVTIGVKNEKLLEFYNTIDGDIDDKAYNSDLLVQKYWQRRRTDSIVRLLDIQKGDIVVDIGCGSGVQIQQLTSYGAKGMIGIDVNRNALLYASRKNIPNTSFIIADAQHLPIKTECVDKIICAEIVEHLIEPECLINEIKRTLRKGGNVVITTPNEYSVWGFYEILWDIFGRGRNYGETHLKFYSKAEIERLFNNFQNARAITIFFVSPIFALTNNETVLEIGKKIDRFFEKYNFGVILVLSSVK